MTIAEKTQAYVNSRIGTQVGNGQCVALFRDYTENFLKTPVLERLGATGGALGLYTRYETDVGPISRSVFKRTTYFPGMVPQEGDCVIFNAMPGNRFGHVGIFTGMAADGRMEIFEQDGIAVMQGRKDAAKIGLWHFTHCLGWLRLRSIE